jgi:hypothetical protein
MSIGRGRESEVCMKRQRTNMASWDDGSWGSAALFYSGAVGRGQAGDLKCGTEPQAWMTGLGNCSWPARSSGRLAYWAAERRRKT